MRALQIITNEPLKLEQVSGILQTDRFVTIHQRWLHLTLPKKDRKFFTHPGTSQYQKYTISDEIPIGLKYDILICKEMATNFEIFKRKSNPIILLEQNKTTTTRFNI